MSHIRIEIITREQLNEMLKRTGWTPELIDVITNASIHSAKAVTTEKVKDVKDYSSFIT